MVVQNALDKANLTGHIFLRLQLLLSVTMSLCLYVLSEFVIIRSIGWETVVKDIMFCSITLLEFQVFGCPILNMRLAPNQSLVSKSQVAIFCIQRNRHALIGRAIDDHDMRRVLEFLKNDKVVDSVNDCKSGVIGPGFFRFKAKIGFSWNKRRIICDPDTNSLQLFEELKNQM
ncbi:hypothetical protein L1987_12028 [Smallanthus sonchifolius]|uniref:Uncharacterized protein n=1 Tax=Smallanthus sonchifolius TaxID=185202 RepID=A0ACB9JF95_9ASTR|nr:hypothetical protein L1987_12028 [Smallanthus sonchifolius]